MCLYVVNKKCQANRSAGDWLMGLPSPIIPLHYSARCDVGFHNESQRLT